MRNSILFILFISCLSLTPHHVKAQSSIKVHLPNANCNFGKKQFTCLLNKSGLSNQLDINSMVNSLQQIKGQWYCYASPKQIKHIARKTGSLISVIFSDYTWETSGTCSFTWETTGACT